MRAVTRDGIQWRVNEIDSSDTPGSRSARCLIFDGDSIMRRVWDYPSDWSELPDETLAALLDNLPRPAKRAAASRDRATGPHTETLRTAAECSERTRSLLAEMALLRESNECLRAGGESLLPECRRQRDAMRAAVEMYAAALRSSGVSPERALVLLKSAMHSGISALPAPDEQEADEIIRDGVAWAIQAYFAA